MKETIATTVVTNKAARVRWWVVTAVIIGLSGCSRPAMHPEFPTPPPELSGDCLEYAHVQEALADLGLQAMQTFGRLDPAIYVQGEQGSLLPNPQLEQPAPEKLDPFQKALARVNNDPKARAALQRGYNAATGGCMGGACPAKAYSITVTRKPTHAPSDQLYTWRVDGPEHPSAPEWKAFETLYAPRPAFCPVLASIVLRTPKNGVAQTSGLFDDESRFDEEAAALGGCPCNYGGEPGRKTKPCTYCPGYPGAMCTPPEFDLRRGATGSVQTEPQAASAKTVIQ